MKHNPHKPIEYLIRVPLACCFFTTGCMFCLSGLIMLYPFRSTAVFILALLSILFGINAFASFGFSVRNFASVVVIDETGMSVRRFNKIKCFIPWDHIRFAGICAKHSYRGLQKRYCFASRELSDEERNDVTLIGVPHIYFSWMTLEELDYIRSHSPVQPDADVEQFLSRSGKKLHTAKNS